jgi:hypothetical protein
MIQQIITVAGTLTGFILGYGFNKIAKKFKKPSQDYAYPEIEITDYHYIDIWEL